ncbi:MAG TPA: hypothetical protein VIV12_27780 [Streptosporangiaceae bacterium]
MSDLTPLIDVLLGMDPDPSAGAALPPTGEDVVAACRLLEIVLAHESDADLRHAVAVNVATIVSRWAERFA